MWKSLLIIVFCASLIGPVADHAHAQAGTKAYAPEDLGRLNRQDQVRVIEKEYSEQARGRRIPDDQLEFYLDQIQSSRWSFSQIKEDIATSLGGGTGGWNRPPAQGPGPVQQEVRCESRDDRYTECVTPFRAPAVVARQLSSQRCVDGANFGSRPGMVWVRSGCRALFVEGAGFPPAHGGGGREITCESRNSSYRECTTGFRGRAQLVRQLSSQPCVAGRNWSSRPGMVWVNHGCRASFVEERGGIGGGGVGVGVDPDYNVTCSSEDNRRKTCAWNAQAGAPRMVEQLSRVSCVEGRTWGYSSRNGLWVDRGCRARFAGN